MLTEQKGSTEKFTNIIGDFNTLYLVHGKSTRQKFSKKGDLNDTTNHLDQTEITERYI